MQRRELILMPQIQISALPGFGSHSVASVELRSFIPSEVASISPIVDHLMPLISACRNADGSDVDIEIALREALANAIVHGNRRDPEKQVEMVCRCGADGAVDITIRDEGQGFDIDEISDSATLENTMSARGRGIYLMQSLMDEVRFEERGTVVHLRKEPNAQRV